LNNLSLDIQKGERLALIGETGSGKTTLGKCLIRLTPVNSGMIFHNNVDLLRLSERGYREYRKKFQMIFQNPTQSLNPVQNILSTLSEPLEIIGGLKGHSLYNKIEELLSMVQLDEALLQYYPHELSGGQKQRIAIARALAVNPVCIIADEPTSSLDASLKMTMVRLLNSLWQNMSLTLVFISHDLSIVSHISDRIAVLYQGLLIELADTKQLFSDPLHPYTKQLVHPGRVNNDFKPKINSRDDSQGCPFAGKCEHVQSICHDIAPLFNSVSENHSVACHYVHNESTMTKISINLKK